MKIFKYLALFVLFAGCNGDNVPNCFQNAGNTITKDFDLNNFEKITVFERIELILIDGPEYRVQLETGEYLENDISAEVEDGRLILKNDNACNITRDYGITKFFVTAPNISEIRNSSGLTVRSEGTLTYPEIQLISEDFEEEDAFHTDGPFRLKINSEQLNVVVNNLSHMWIEGEVERLSLNYFSGDARFDGENLMAQEITISHRGTNDFILNPQESISGIIRGTGDVILVNEPPVIDVEELYTGRLIIRD